MKILLQRVAHASVEVDSKTVGKIESGLLLLVGFGKDDDESVLKPMAEKVCNLRVFSDEKGRFHYSVLEQKGGILAVPQFTLYADTSKGRRPEFFSAAEPEAATALFDSFVEVLRTYDRLSVETGIFGAHMKVELLNDGPVSIMLEK